jgi:hypothetical protein
MNPAWRSWYHCTVGTYAAWLPGDPRGWRERNHHEHVEGDYKRPPEPAAFNTARHYAKRLVRGQPYRIAPADRQPIAALLIQNFLHNKVPLLALAVCEKNFHALLQVPDGRVKRMLGLAKRHVTFSFATTIDASHRRTRLWEREAGVTPINDRAHGDNAFQYILDHIDEGGWVWSFRDPSPPIFLRPRRRRRRALPTMIPYNPH